MTVTVLRGTCQIGGSIIEVASNTTRLILDVGSELNDTEPPRIPLIDGLFQGNPAYEAVLISHGHRDHTGLLNAVLPGIPIFMGIKTYEILKLSTEKIHGSLQFVPVLFDGNGERSDGSLHFSVGDITITPYLCDHSAFDSHMFLLECGEERILYTGDFRSNGRLSFDALLSRLPSHVDKLIIEGTTLGHESEHSNESEMKLELKMAQLMKCDMPVFVLSASTHMDRMVTIYRAAQRAKRLLAVDTYQANVLSLAGKGLPTPLTHSGIRVIQIGGASAHKELERYSEQKISRAALAKKDFVLCVRTSKHWKYWLKKLAELRSLSGSILIYSMWDGYRQQEHLRTFLEACEHLGMRIVPLHTGGHADMAAIKRLHRQLGKPEIIPVHTEHPELMPK